MYFVLYFSNNKTGPNATNHWTNRSHSVCLKSRWKQNPTPSASFFYDITNAGNNKQIIHHVLIIHTLDVKNSSTEICSLFLCIFCLFFFYSSLYFLSGWMLKGGPIQCDFHQILGWYQYSTKSTYISSIYCMSTPFCYISQIFWWQQSVYTVTRVFGQ